MSGIYSELSPEGSVDFNGPGELRLQLGSARLGRSGRPVSCRGCRFRNEYHNRLFLLTRKFGIKCVKRLPLPYGSYADVSG